MQVISVSQAYQFLARLNKEYALSKIPGLLLVCSLFDLIMGKWIAAEKIQQLPLQILLA